MSGCARPWCAPPTRPFQADAAGRVTTVTGAKLQALSADHAEVSTRRTAQFLGLLRVAPGPGLGTFHQVMGHAVNRRHGAGKREKTENLRKKGVHVLAPADGEKLRYPYIKGFP